MENTFETIGNVAGSTVRVTVGDTSQALTDMIDTAMGSAVNWNNVRAIEIHVESYDCRIAFGRGASTTVGGLRYTGQRERIPNRDRIQAAHVINATPGSLAVLQIDIEY